MSGDWKDFRMHGLEVGTVKLNVSSFCAEDRPVGLGIIARTQLGNTLTFISRDALANPVVAETDAVRVVLLMA